MTHPEVPYAGVATRAVALTIDAAIAQAIVFTIGAVVALIGSLVSSGQLDTAGKLAAGVAWFVVVGTYFVLFWTIAGETPGMRVMGVRLTTYDGSLPGVKRSLVRLIGLALAIILLFLGFVPALIDARRRALQDFLARTVVLYADSDVPPLPEPAAVRAARDVQSSA